MPKKKVKTFWKKKIKLIKFIIDEHLYKTYVNFMTDEAIPPEPTRQQEIQYLDYLQKSFSEDPFITIHPKLYGASPYRHYFRYYQEMQFEYRKTFIKNMMCSIVVSWPLII